MVVFHFTSRFENGLDIRRAGKFVKEAIKCSSKVSIRNGEKHGDAKLIFNVMSLNIKPGDVVEIAVEGDSEAYDAAMMEQYAAQFL